MEYIFIINSLPLILFIHWMWMYPLYIQVCAITKGDTGRERKDFSGILTCKEYISREPSDYAIIGFQQNINLRFGLTKFAKRYPIFAELPFLITEVVDGGI